MGESHPQPASMATELALLLVLATLWGASYTFIRVGVATIPPVTLIACRTLIAGLLLLAIMRWRGVAMPVDAATWRRFLFQACLNSVIPWTMVAWGIAGAGCRGGDHPQLHRADIHVFPDASPSPATRR